MRHRAMFQTDMPIVEVCLWFREELLKLDFQPHGSISDNKYDFEFSVGQEGQRFTFSLFHNPSVENSVCLYVKPKLGFFSAILGKSDRLRELATSHSHAILSSATHINNLGWYNESQVWKGATNAP